MKQSFSFLLKNVFNFSPSTYKTPNCNGNGLNKKDFVSLHWRGFLANRDYSIYDRKQFQHGSAWRVNSFLFTTALPAKIKFCENIFLSWKVYRISYASRTGMKNYTTKVETFCRNEIYYAFYKRWKKPLRSFSTQRFYSARLMLTGCFWKMWVLKSGQQLKLTEVGTPTVDSCFSCFFNADGRKKNIFFLDYDWQLSSNFVEFFDFNVGWEGCWLYS